MQLTTFIISAALALSSGAAAWTQDGNGVWVANNNWYTIRGVRVHESCTHRGDSGTILRNGEFCKWWTNGAGSTAQGSCQYNSKDNTAYCQV
ncbi:hypothetical protein B0T22DRAFT_298034 [Podospora appendiculata]|uniref:Uncharacterized protein n=1 Tax=Podospora appendiculata TaxID=314037 RepID=A0AAE1C8Q6_9PEZI|nr:hypothetical protein B0T22DRAFT_298034 [Podospora appendiculata]